MKQDIRDLFKSEDESGTKQLPNNHREEFLAKLKENKQNKSSIYIWLRLVAVLVIALTVSFFIFKSEGPQTETSPLLAQVEAVEAEYLKNIETEWQNFKQLATDEVLVKRYDQKLKDLDADYQEISEAFKNDTNNILVVESLIQNLQTRLQLLKDIQEHIKILNKKTAPDETTI
ncbi:hypothetical protein Q2T40_07465 [Winogradskyella maritima]|uniref:Anti-sigma factor n=1 Tax=Winogradskyella maritima TaxID=1517766 RepID=A0ABV8ANB1_9FLAO|nr:hypothetical protein [Winogradskyella maritima]